MGIDPKYLASETVDDMCTTVAVSPAASTDRSGLPSLSYMLLLLSYTSFLSFIPLAAAHEQWSLPLLDFVSNHSSSLTDSFCPFA
jgi:hypothetical protein